MEIAAYVFIILSIVAWLFLPVPNLRQFQNKATKKRFLLLNKGVEFKFVLATGTLINAIVLHKTNKGIFYQIKGNSSILYIEYERIIDFVITSESDKGYIYDYTQPGTRINEMPVFSSGGIIDKEENVLLEGWLKELESNTYLDTYENYKKQYYKQGQQIGKMDEKNFLESELTMNANRNLSRYVAKTGVIPSNIILDYTVEYSDKINVYLNFKVEI